MGSCSEDLLKRDTIVQSEFEFDGSFKNYNFFSFNIACMCHYTAVVGDEISLPYNSANVRPAIIKSLPFQIVKIYGKLYINASTTTIVVLKQSYKIDQSYFTKKIDQYLYIKTKI